MSPYLAEQESKSIFIIREAYARVRKLAMLWSIGKDSTAMLWLVRKAFLGRVPFPLVLLDTGMEMDEVYAFRDRLVTDWQLPIINHPCPPLDQIDPKLPPATRSAMRKTEGLKTLLAQESYQGILCGIRRDEQGLRAKERVFSPRRSDGSWDYKDQPAELWDMYSAAYPDKGHVRIHPLLHWTELDIWEYTKAEQIPVCDLYFARGGKRYRSLGEKNITFPVESHARDIDDVIAELKLTRVAERAGRSMDQETEDSFEQLRTQGYM